MAADSARRADIALNLIDCTAATHHAVLAERAREAAFDEICAPLRRAWHRGLSLLVGCLSVQALRRARIDGR